MSVLSAGAGAAYAAAPEGEIADIVVTAQRRTESIQNVPITIQAFTAETLNQLNVTTFDDYARYLPNVTASTQLPGVGQIYMRGLATTEDGPQSSGATGSFPNVAVYLDEQSAQLPGRNLDIYAADIERIEVLEGPQGTLFGAGAQAGVIRYITNKPKLNKTEAIVNAGYATTAHGADSNSVDATLNLPIIPDRFAIRGVVYAENRGGYINNVSGTFTRQSTDRGLVDYFNTVGYGNPGTGYVPPGINQISNDKISGSSFNPVTYKGFRLSGLVQINDDWSVLVAQSYQAMEADGVFAQMNYAPDCQNPATCPKLPDLSVVQFNPSYDKDRFSNTAWTLTGRIGALKMVYTGGYLTRNVEQVADYTNYTRGVYADYYQCILPGSTQAVNMGIPGGECFSPSSTFKVIQHNTHQNHEFRLSTPDDWRIRAIGGLFWEDFKVEDQSDWYYRAIEAGFVPLGFIPGSGQNNYNQRDPTDAFYDDIQRGYKQKAAFASVDIDIVPKKLTFTAGTRYYNMDTYETGVKASSYGCRPGGYYSGTTVASPCVSGSFTDLATLVVPPGNDAFSDNAQGLEKTYKGFRSRLNLSWHVTNDVLTYATWSQGFRPGGFNRASGFVAPATSPLHDIFETPIGFKPDTLTNWEVGWKTQWFNHKLQFNGAAYLEDWKDVQIGLFDPGLLGNLTFSTNGPAYRVKGLESEVIARVAHGLTITGSASWNHSWLYQEVSFKDKNGNPIDFQALGFQNPFGTKDSPLAMSPPLQSSLRARYEWTMGDYEAFAQLGGTHRGHSYVTTDALSVDLTGSHINYELPAFSTADASVGLSRDAWTAQLYVNNLTDERGIVFSSYNQWIKMDTPIRPRTAGIRFGYKFGGQ